MQSFKLLARILLISVAIIQIGCDKDFEYNANPRPDGKFSGTIIDYIRARKDVFSILDKAIERAGLSTTLSTGTYTLFAPDDIAFRAFLGNKQLADIPAEQLKNIILLHLLDRKVLSSDLTLDVNPYATQLPGRYLNLNRNAEYVVTVNGNRVFLSNVEPSNGAVHVIPSVLK